MTSPRPRVGDQIETAAQLDALPVGSVVLDRDGDAWQSEDINSWHCTVRSLNSYDQPSHSVTSILGPLTVVHVPGAQPRTPEPAPATIEEALEVVKCAIDDAFTFEGDLDPGVDKQIVQALAAAGMLRTPVTAEQARAEAQRRWPSYRTVGFSGAEDRQIAFIEGAVWATRVPIEGSQG